MIEKLLSPRFGKENKSSLYIGLDKVLTVRNLGSKLELAKVLAEVRYGGYFEDGNYISVDI